MDNENQNNSIESETKTENYLEPEPVEYYENSEKKANVTQDENQQQEPLEEPDINLLFAALDGLLLIHSKPVSFEKLADLLEVNEEKVTEIVNARKKTYEEDENSGLQIVVLEDKVQLATKARVSQFIQRLDGQKLVSLSMPALEA